MFTIIEDCSPYYIRFTYDGMEQVIDICNEALEADTFADSRFLTLNEDKARQVLDNNSIHKLIPLKDKRAVMLRTPPGAGWRAHKDGFSTKCSFNYSIRILDDKSETTWYADEEFSNHQMDYSISPPSREVLDFDKNNHTPACTLRAKPNECMLINVNIFHAWDNTQSTNERVMLTLRAVDQDVITFEQARFKLFGY